MSTKRSNIRKIELLKLYEEPSILAHILTLFTSASSSDERETVKMEISVLIKRMSQYAERRHAREEKWNELANMHSQDRHSRQSGCTVCPAMIQLGKEEPADFEATRASLYLHLNTAIKLKQRPPNSFCNMQSAVGRWNAIKTSADADFDETEFRDERVPSFILSYHDDKLDLHGNTIIHAKEEATEDATDKELDAPSPSSAMDDRKSEEPHLKQIPALSPSLSTQVTTPPAPSTPDTFSRLASRPVSQRALAISSPSLPRGQSSLARSSSFTLQDTPTPFSDSVQSEAEEGQATDLTTQLQDEEDDENFDAMDEYRQFSPILRVHDHRPPSEGRHGLLRRHNTVGSVSPYSEALHIISRCLLTPSPVALSAVFVLLLSLFRADKVRKVCEMYQTCMVETGLVHFTLSALRFGVTAEHCGFLKYFVVVENAWASAATKAECSNVDPDEAITHSFGSNKEFMAFFKPHGTSSFVSFISKCLPPNLLSTLFVCSPKAPSSDPLIHLSPLPFPSTYVPPSPTALLISDRHSFTLTAFIEYFNAAFFPSNSSIALDSFAVSQRLWTPQAVTTLNATTDLLLDSFFAKWEANRFCTFIHTTHPVIFDSVRINTHDPLLALLNQIPAMLFLFLLRSSFAASCVVCSFQKRKNVPF
ncbi:hypothetical protein BLNAU_14369 [Blattamonas nauphoetae]|uniref:Uncharacterized protein n=1 Tax=Blattamonas nauphoetae TaxID=2049346 RepID=A0ABQ9XE10_9EUKA|nr:hypothetical protein BLNAU_14369 [Blattamonas nauphoetae]